VRAGGRGKAGFYWVCWGFTARCVGAGHSTLLEVVLYCPHCHVGCWMLSILDATFLGGKVLTMRASSLRCAITSYLLFALGPLEALAWLWSGKETALVPMHASQLGSHLICQSNVRSYAFNSLACSRFAVVSW
jgi:hypothetical protein